MDERLNLTQAEAAAQLRMSRTTLRALVRRGDIPCIHIGRRRLISRQVLEEWVARNSNGRFQGRAS